MNDLLTDPTPVVGGSWVTISYYQNLLGALNLFTSWSSLATQWANNLPTSWGQQNPVINTNGMGVADAVIQVQIPSDTTIGGIATLVNGISPDVSIRSVTVNGASPADPATVQAQASGNVDTLFGGVFSDPIGAISRGVSQIAGSITLLAAVLILGYILYETKPWRYLPRPKRKR